MGIDKNSMLHIEIDGVKFNVSPGSKIIEVSDEAGIYIPRFCYHKKLSISANCRMCLVEVEKMPKLAPACATPVTNGMRVFTNTFKVVEAQRAVMEFLLINHPLDCPICDQGGECELQDLTIGYGCTFSRFEEEKRLIEDYDIGPLVSTDFTRCILCSRCVRFLTEISGIDEFGIINRGNSSRIYTFLRENLNSFISGNVIDLCPVGALTAKPSRYKARAWDLMQYPFISVHDCIGSNLFVHVYKNKVLRVVPRRNDDINDVWISDRDRFSYEGLYSKYRLENPMIKVDGKWIETTWENACNYSYTRLYDIKEKHGASALCTVASPNSTLEEFYVLQKLFRSIGSNNIDHRIKQSDFKKQEDFPIVPGLDMELSEIDEKDFVFIVGVDLIKEQPIISLRLRKAVNNSADLFVLNPVDFSFDINIKEKYIQNLNNFINVLSEIIKTIIVKKELDLSSYNLFDKIKLTGKYDGFVSSLLSKKNKLVLTGSLVNSSPDFSKIMSLLIMLSKLIDANFGLITDGCNSAGGYIAGFLPFRYPSGRSIDANIGLNTKEMLFNAQKAYVLFGLDPEFDTFYGFNTINSLKNSNFVLSFTSFVNNTLFNVADVLLPIASSYENCGTYVNLSNKWQTFNSVVSAAPNVKLGWEAICFFSKYFSFAGFDYFSFNDVLNELKLNVENKVFEACSWKNIKIDDLISEISCTNLISVPMVSCYGIDALVRRATSLQNTTDAVNSKKLLFMNSVTATKCNANSNLIYVVSNSKKTAYSLLINDLISNNSVLISNNCSKIYESFNLPYSVIYLDNK